MCERMLKKVSSQITIYISCIWPVILISSYISHLNRTRVMPECRQLTRTQTRQRNQSDLRCFRTEQYALRRYSFFWRRLAHPTNSIKSAHTHTHRAHNRIPHHHRTQNNPGEQAVDTHTQQQVINNIRATGTMHKRAKHTTHNQQHIINAARTVEQAR